MQKNVKKLTALLLALVVVAVVAEARPKVALVLGGGGAKGAAEVGVLKYIEKSGLPIDMIVGTSIGSVLGGLYSVGYRANDLEEMFRSQEWINLLTDRKTDDQQKPYHKDSDKTLIFGVPLGGGAQPWAKGFGAIRGDSIVSHLDKMTRRKDSISFGGLPIPFKCVAVDVKSMKEVVLASGRLSLAMRASMAIPLLFKPIKWGGRTLVDGGVLNNLPVDVARSMGADIVVAIDLTQNKPPKKTAFETPSLLKHIPWLDWLANRPDQAKYWKNVKDADIYINPQLTDCSVVSFSKIPYMIAEGEKSGKRFYKKLVKLRKQVLGE